MLSQLRKLRSETDDTAAKSSSSNDPPISTTTTCRRSRGRAKKTFLSSRSLTTAATTKSLRGGTAKTIYNYVDRRPTYFENSYKPQHPASLESALGKTRGRDLSTVYMCTASAEAMDKILEKNQNDAKNNFLKALQLMFENVNQPDNLRAGDLDAYRRSPKLTMSDLHVYTAIRLAAGVKYAGFLPDNIAPDELRMLKPVEDGISCCCTTDLSSTQKNNTDVVLLSRTISNCAIRRFVARHFDKQRSAMIEDRLEADNWKFKIVVDARSLDVLTSSSADSNNKRKRRATKSAEINNHNCDVLEYTLARVYKQQPDTLNVVFGPKDFTAIASPESKIQVISATAYWFVVYWFVIVERERRLASGSGLSAWLPPTRAQVDIEFPFAYKSKVSRCRLTTFVIDELKIKFPNLLIKTCFSFY